MPKYAKISQYTAEENAFWQQFTNCAGQTFTTIRGLDFSFQIRGNEVIVSRKEKSLTRATVIQGYRKAKELIKIGQNINGPRVLGVFGASYLMPIFNALGVFDDKHPTIATMQVSEDLPLFSYTIKKEPR